MVSILSNARQLVTCCMGLILIVHFVVRAKWATVNVYAQEVGRITQTEMVDRTALKVAVKKNLVRLLTVKAEQTDIKLFYEVVNQHEILSNVCLIIAASIYR